MVESFGIVFPNNDPAAVPQLSPTYESNVKGIYVVGALGGYPLIKQAMNQGYEVVGASSAVRSSLPTSRCCAKSSLGCAARAPSTMHWH